MWCITTLILNYLKPEGLNSYLRLLKTNSTKSVYRWQEVIAPLLWTERCHVSPPLGKYMREAAKWSTILDKLICAIYSVEECVAGGFGLNLL